MNSFTLFPQQSYKAKTAGLILSTIALGAMLWEKAAPFVIIKNLSELQHSQLFFLLILFGLFIVAFSKEQVDDDRVKVIRGKAFQSGFGIIISLMIALCFVGIVKPTIILSLSTDVPLIILIGLVIYLLIFNIGLYSDPLWIRSDQTVLSNIKRNKTFFIIYLVILLVVIGYLFLNQ